jgi:hypothetical protein
LPLLVVLTAQPMAAAYFYYLIGKSNEISGHRMMEIRSFPENLRCGVVKYWIGKHVPLSGAVLVVGDSQPFGWRAKSANIFSELLGDGQQAVRNLAIVDGYFNDVQNVLEIAAGENIKPAAVILNVDPAHFKTEYKTPRYLTGHQCSALSLSQVLFERNLLASTETMALARAGANPEYQAPWFLRDQDTEPLPPGTMAEPFADDYITDRNNVKYEADFISALDAAKSVSDKVIVYMSPMQLYKKLPHAQKKIRGRYMQLCGQYAAARGGVICLDPSDQFSDKDFLDIVHFSSEGHRKMADILRPLISGKE